ncbi:MAG TPA: ATP-binding cassette domain-containing protein [Myxococcaceae bacterium]|nr:ATP-binding cassette domain-containing protein [Myxococcaceae bacterium]
MLTIEGLEVSIQSVKILRGVSLRVGPGQIAGLIGRNGAGKTTLLRAVMGLLPWRRGNISFEGRSLSGLPAHARTRLGIGYMPEDRRLIPELSAEENVLLPAWAVGLKDAAQRLAWIYERMPEVQSFAGRKAVLLSGGQQKLVALARALMSGTKMLLLDEPFEGVAPVLARRLAEVVVQLNRQGLSVIVSKSDLADSKEMLDVMISIDRGAVRHPEGEGVNTA